MPIPDGLFDELVADAFERPLPVLTRREARLAWMKGKADAVVGMRRAGKTWFTFQVMRDLLAAGWPRESLLYASFDDERLAELGASELGRLVDAFYRRWPAMRDRECAFFFDEIQMVAGWERFVRRLLDSENARICLSGSSAKLLSREIATSMRGRGISTEIFPFGFGESAAHVGLERPRRRPTKRQRSLLEHHMDLYLVRGGFPEAQELDDRRRAQLLQGYLDAVLLRDVIERHGISNPVALRRFARQLMNAPGGRVSVHRIYHDLRSQGVAVSKGTLHAFLDHLTDAYLFFTVPIASDSERVRQSNPRKIYGIDPGLVRACATSRRTDIGHLFETFVFLELRRRGTDIAYFHTEADEECDFVVRDGDRTSLVQACVDLSDLATRQRELRATVAGMEHLSLDTATIVTLREEGLVRDGRRRIRLVPAWLWALERAAATD